ENSEVPMQIRNTDYDFWLISPRIDLTLTNNLFITGLAQYNNQINNTNLNLRMQWRYSPASDIFLVYTDNYFTDVFQSKNRAVVFKVNYWWNI
ncbi:MAG TPA: hydrolase, partial [Saprospiraceae bacterium]|nr:hydrolase [Saprospiraceae bacterium]